MVEGSESGTLEAVWIKRFRGGPMDPVGRARMLAHRGLDGDANRSRKRQVTILSAESWRVVCEELGADLDPSLRRANLLVGGIELAESRGRVLAIGRCRVLIHGETRPCHQMEEAHAGLQQTLGPDWRGGAYGEVLDGGEIAVGDPVRWLPQP